MQPSRGLGRHLKRAVRVDTTTRLGFVALATAAACSTGNQPAPVLTSPALACVQERAEAEEARRALAEARLAELEQQLEAERARIASLQVRCARGASRAAGAEPAPEGRHVPLAPPPAARAGQSRPSRAQSLQLLQTSNPACMFRLMPGPR